MRHRFTVLGLLPLLLLLVIAAGCGGGKDVDTIPSAPAEDVEEMPTPPPDEPVRVDEPAFPTERFDERVEEPTSIDELNRMGVLRTIYFAFDSYELTPTSTATLRENAEWLKAHRDHNVVVEGHCDERGTIEYNLALGERRANSVRDYLVSLGLDRSRLRIVTYGEERPASPGHNEASWSQNRRAEFLLER